MLLLVVLVAFATADAPYFRFWSGYRLASLDRTSFREGMQWFLNQTTHISNCGGLRLYVVPLIDTTGLPDYIPDEIALLQYKSADLYHSFYSTPIGQYYQKLHGRFFDMNRSYSLVPEDFNGSLQVNKAYCFPNCNFVWTDMFPAVSIVYNESSIDLPTLQFAVEKESSLANVEATVVGVYEKYAKIVYFFATAEQRDEAKISVTAVNQILGEPVGPVYQIAENVTPPLTLEFGQTVNVTIGPCTLNNTSKQ